MTTFKCPHCGVRLAVVYGEDNLLPGYERPATWDHTPAQPLTDRVQALGAMMRQPTGESTYQTYRHGPGTATAAWKEVSFEQPARAASVPSDVQVPLLQAVVTGLFVGAFVSIGGIWLAVRNGWAWYIPPAAGALSWLVTAGLMWSNLLIDSRALLRRVERYVGHEDTPKPTVEPESVRAVVETTEPDGRITYDDITYWPETKRVLEAYLNRRITRISRREIQSLRISETKATRIISDLENGDYIFYPNGKTSVSELTARGRALARRI